MPESGLYIKAARAQHADGALSHLRAPHGKTQARSGGEAEAITLLRLEKPLKETAAVSGKLEKDFFLVTPMSDQPDIA